MRSGVNIFKIRTAGRLFALALALPLIYFALSSPAYGSTLWAAAGGSVSGGGTLIGKNYDAPPGKCEFRLVVPRQGFSYFGLFPIPSRKGQGPVAAINQKGLVIVSAAAEASPRGKGGPPGERIAERLLTDFESVEALISDRTVFKGNGAAFYLCADGQRIVSIETGIGGHVAVKETGDGVLSHTNHYMDDALSRGAPVPSADSLSRLGRVESLLKGLKGPFTMEDFIAVGWDKDSAPEETILKRTESRTATRTVASWILYSPRTGAPELHVTTFYPEEQRQEYDFRFDRPFWTEGLE